MKKKLFYGWWVLIACATIQFYFGGTFNQGFTALFNPVVNEFGWSYTLVSLGFTVRGVENGALAPLVGFFVDKVRPRRLLFAGTIIMALGFFFFSRMHTLWGFYASLMTLSLGLSMSANVIVVTAVAAWFKRRTTLAMGILTSGAGATGLLAPAIVWLIDGSGWRTAVTVFAIGAMVICLPLCFVVKDPPEDTRGVKGNPLRPMVSRDGMTIKEVLGTKTFWLMSLSFMFAMVASSAIVVHEVPYMVSVGMSRQTAGFMVMVLALSAIAGRLVFGFVGDRTNKRYCFVVASFIQVGGLFAFAVSQSLAQFIPALILVGIGFGGIAPLIPSMQIEFFGMKAFGVTQGLLRVFYTAGALISPPFAGWVFDRFGYYRTAFLALAAVSLLAIPLMLMVRRPAPFRAISTATD